MDVYAPFCILDNYGNVSAVFGDSADEAKRVAWALTATAYGANNLAPEGTVCFCEARRRCVKGGNMLNELLGAGNAVVDMRAFENKHHFRYGIDPMDECHDDRFYLRLAEAEVQQSMHTWLVNLDLAMTALYGLDADQISSSATEDAMRARNNLVVELSRVINSGASPEDVARCAREAEATYAGRALRKRRAELEGRFLCVKALVGLAAAVSEGRSVEEVLQRNYAAIKSVCLCPPRHLTDALMLGGVSISLLRVCFPQLGAQSIVGASSLAPSWQKTAEIMKDYFLRVDRDGLFRNACVAAMAVMRSEMAEPVSSPAWSGVQLAASAPACAHSFSLQPPAHCDGQPMVLVATQTSPPALRVVRLLRAVRTVH